MQASVKIRQATRNDLHAISTILQDLTAAGKRTSPDDPDFVRERYIDHPDLLRCSIAEDVDGTILGFQILKQALEGNDYGVTPGWGIIGTHVNPAAARRGVGKALFTATMEAAKITGLLKIDATISATNSDGQAYYASMGFSTYRTRNGAICKCLNVKQ